MTDEGTEALSRDEVMELILELSTNVGLTEALADDILDASGVVQWAAANVHHGDEDAEAEFRQAADDLEEHIQELSREGYDTPLIVLGLWFHLQQIELFLRDAPDDEQADVTPFEEHLPVEEKLPETPLRPQDEVEAFIEELSTHVGLTEALVDDALDAGHLVTWATARSHDAMSPGGEAEFTQVVERFTEFITEQEQAGREWAMIVYAIWMHVQELERYLRDEQPDPPSESTEDGDIRNRYLVLFLPVMSEPPDKRGFGAALTGH